MKAEHQLRTHDYYFSLLHWRLKKTGDFTRSTQYYAAVLGFEPIPLTLKSLWSTQVHSSLVNGKEWLRFY